MIKLFAKKRNTSDKTVKVHFKIDGMHCVSCSLNIDGELEDTKGVVSATTSYARGTCEVEYDPGVVKEKQLVSIIVKLGYKVVGAQ